MSEAGAFVQAGRAVMELMEGTHEAGSLASRAQAALHAVPADSAMWDHYATLQRDMGAVEHGASFAGNLDDQIAMSIAKRGGVAGGDALATPEHPRWAHFMDTLHLAMDADPTRFTTVREDLAELTGRGPTEASATRYALNWNPQSMRARSAVVRQRIAEMNLPGLPATPVRPGISPPGQPSVPSINFGTASRRKKFSLLSPNPMVRPGTMNSFPKRKNHRLKWATCTPSSTTGSVAATCIAQKVKLSCLENPGEYIAPQDLHEPLGFTQMSAIYSRYAVREAVIRVDYVNKSPSDSSPDAITLGIALKDDTTTLTTHGYYEELDHTTWHVVPAEGVGTIYLRIKPYEFFGIPAKQIYSDNDYIQLIGAGSDGVNTLYAHIFYHRMNNTSVVEETVEFNVAVHYDVTFLEPKDVAQS